MFLWCYIFFFLIYVVQNLNSLRTVAFYEIFMNLKDYKELAKGVVCWFQLMAPYNSENL